MVINENNSQINAFVKGMNSDTAYDQVDNQQYVFGKNIRITKNDFVGGTSGDVASLHEGAITPVPRVKPQYAPVYQNDENPANGVKFLASDSIGNIAVIVVYVHSESEHKLKVFKWVYNEDTAQFNFKWTWWVNLEDNIKIKAASTVMYQEQEDVVKLYIATGVFPIIELRVDGDRPSSTNVDDYINNRILPVKPVFIQDKIDGALKTSQVQYTYRFYNKFGITTQLAPLTNKIQVIDDNRSKEVGNAQDTTTAVGFKLKIASQSDTTFNRLQIFRLQYTVPGEDANVVLIYDGECDPSSDFIYNDVGTVELQNLTMQEFASMSGMVIIPKVIEQNQQYLFAANVTDDTIIEDVTDSHGIIECVTTNVTLSTNTNDVPVQDTHSFNASTEIGKYLQDRNISTSLVKNTYNNIFTSSLIRSLRRGEKYKYGIVYYDKYGRHSNVVPIYDAQEHDYIQIPEISSGAPLINTTGGQLTANVYGVKITIPQPKVEGVVGCQIVRRSSKSIYQKTLLQVALARPIRQNLYDVSLSGEDFSNLRNATNNNLDTVSVTITPNKSPYYPSGFLFLNNVRITSGYYIEDGEEGEELGWAASDNSSNIYQIFSQEIDFRRDDVLSRLKSSSLSVRKAFGCYLLAGDTESAFNTQSAKYLQNNSQSLFGVAHSYNGNRSRLFIEKRRIQQTADSKSTEYMLFPLYNTTYTFSGQSQSDIKNVKDVKLPTWYDGFSNLQLDGSQIAAGGIKKYKQFTTGIENATYNNWVSFGLYDLRISKNDSQPNVDGFYGAYVAQLYARSDLDAVQQIIDSLQWMIGDSAAQHVAFGRRGYIGPGPSCFLISTENALASDTNFGTTVCNLQHDTTEGDNEPDEFVQYFGFGNFFQLKQQGSIKDHDLQYEVVHNYSNPTQLEKTQVVVFDGDVYITPHELTTMYKAYDFMSFDTLQSMQVVNYVPMESKVNTFFDYGMNFLNTSSANLMLEPGSIDGITTQDRPQHQYNQIYSANDESNDVFSLVVEKNENNEFKQRTYYSEPKTNGEYVDNFVIFKPASYIDVDPKYGQITNLLTDKNILYYWQETGFGKFSVNERSLINDQNGNTIMLGQAGILSRNDYISTKYGMRMYDFCATCAENGVFWADINNKAIVGADSSQAINLGEARNVQNIINRKISEDIPRMDYDLQNNELLCKCLQDGEQIIFNLKANIATSIYTRVYKDIINIHNHLFGFVVDGFEKFNYIDDPNNYQQHQNKYLTPIAVSFVVNPSASITKVFDSQMLVPAKRKAWGGIEPEYTSLVYTFETDIMYTNNNVEQKTDREGNIIYNIPRFGSGDYGNRLRGKWMRVNISTDNPDEFTTISHVITKFRQSYS